MSNKKPKYIEISNHIISQIETGNLQPGDRIPSENELIKTHGISNTTARKVLNEIENQGWVTRLKGKGTFVLNRAKEIYLTRTLGSFHAMKESFSENLIKDGFTPRNILLEKSIIDNGFSMNINNKTYIMNGQILKIHRLRYADDFVMKDETRYISIDLCKRIHLMELDTPLLNIYEDKYKLKPEEIQRTLSATIAFPNAENNYFENKQPIPVFILNGITFCNGGKIVEFEHSYYRGDKYKFSISTTPEMSVKK